MWGALDFGYVVRQAMLWPLGLGIQLPKAYYNERESFQTASTRILRQTITMLFVFYHTIENYLFSGHVFLCTLLIGFFLPNTGITPVFLAPVAKLYWEFLTGDAATPIPQQILDVTKVMGSLMTFVIISIPLTTISYELYYYWQARGRWRVKGSVSETGDIVVISKGGDVHPTLGMRPYTTAGDREWWMVIEWVLYPVVGIFSSVISLYVCLMHLITDRLDYQVSAKPESAKTQIVGSGGEEEKNEKFLVVGSSMETPVLKDNQGALKDIEMHSLVEFSLSENSGPSSRLRKLQNVLRHTFQRLSGLAVLLMMPFLMLAPYYAPTFFAFYYTVLMIAISIITFRTVVGIFVTTALSIRKAKTDWMLKREQDVDSLLKLRGSDSKAEFGADDELMTIQEVMHVIVVPNYKETLGTLTETLDVLASHALAKTNYKVCLAMEENESGSGEKAVGIIAGYSGRFHTITYTVHPKNIEGEIRGKSSNTNWACTQLYRRLIATGSLQEAYSSNPLKPETIQLNESDPIPAETQAQIKRHVYTCMDADSCFAADFFIMVAYEYTTLSPSARKAAIFIPSIVFDRNSDTVNTFTRMVDKSWSAIQVGVFIPGYPFKPATSAYCVPMELAHAVGFWDTGREALGEDYHMTFKCFFATSGRLRVTPIYSPASQCNVVGTKPTLISGIFGRVQQTRRHMWGALDFGYVVRQAMLWPLGLGIQLPKSYYNERESFLTGCIRILRQTITISFVFYHTVENYVFASHIFICSLLVGFFLPNTAITPVFLAPVAKLYWGFLTGNVATPIDSQILDTTRVMSNFMVLVLAGVPLTGIGYELYYHWQVRGRWRIKSSMSETGEVVVVSKGGDVHPTLGMKPYTTARDREWWMVVEWILYPIVGIFTSSMLLYCCLVHLITDRLDYQVSAKPESAKTQIVKATGGEKEMEGASGLNVVSSRDTLVENNRHVT
ncbi:UNVERIFIED_CONTAM: hypothetical protein HDU68_007704 [Siphonaria sp. JEL0065]|nr:hypothetical protein HDU68_007704 [Siphonaria sp. JEL0065]